MIDGAGGIQCRHRQTEAQGRRHRRYGRIRPDAPKQIQQTAPQGGTIRLSFSLSDSALSSALAVLGKIRGENPEVKPEILPGNCKVALYDANMVNTPGVAAKVFTLLAEAGIQVILVTTSEVDISLLVSEHDLPDALAIMREAYGVEPIQAEF